jgi:hypothetical protein
VRNGQKAAQWYKLGMADAAIAACFAAQRQFLTIVLPSPQRQQSEGETEMICTTCDMNNTTHMNLRHLLHG